MPRRGDVGWQRSYVIILHTCACSLCDALVIRSATKVTREVFEAAKVRRVAAHSS